MLNKEILNYRVKSPALKTFAQKQFECESIFNNLGVIFHLFTPCDMEILFGDDDDLRFGVNLMAICNAHFSEIKILTFTIMNNHIHCVLAGREYRCREMFEMYRRKLMRYLNSLGRKVDLASFVPSLLLIDNLKTLRNTILYVNRNRYVVDSSLTPFSDKWGSGGYFFNEYAYSLPVVSYSSLSYKEKCSITRSRIASLPEKYMVYNGMITPSSFCCIDEAQKCFMDAHSYVNALVKDHEAFSDVSKMIGDEGFLTDNELYSHIWSYCNKTYGVKQLGRLSIKDKIEVARMMHFKFHASNGQILRMLQLESYHISELFPKAY